MNMYQHGCNPELDFECLLITRWAHRKRSRVYCTYVPESRVVPFPRNFARRKVMITATHWGESDRMRRDYHNWFTHRLGRHMELLAYGHSGIPVLVFPTSQGKFYEYENSGMIHAVWRKIESGHLQFFCVDSVDSESWYNRSIHPHDRV